MEGGIEDEDEEEKESTTRRETTPTPLVTDVAYVMIPRTVLPKYGFRLC